MEMETRETIITDFDGERNVNVKWYLCATAKTTEEAEKPQQQ